MTVSATILGGLWCALLRREKRARAVHARPCVICKWPAALSSATDCCPACVADPRWDCIGARSALSAEARTALIAFLAERGMFSEQRARRTLPRLHPSSGPGRDLVVGARRLCAESRSDLVDGHEPEPTSVYDMGADLLGMCVECEAWPGERHLGHECLGDVFWAAWDLEEPREVAAVLAVGALFNELGAAADIGLTLALLDERVGFHLGPPEPAPEEGRRTGRLLARQVADLVADRGWTVLEGGGS
ncbi:hypothetical protein SAMN02745121_00260 [Nannocystis exedens]|uniref:Uncharacterized protein n=1 Tax=Nannocystis exedens TaxID=54 RepID=A0A1I1SYE2_9BACT|nr:hypothetical protein [Nannocystis exedens]PCC75720.1 hypothetical protein NAEX_08833 [Nannocystis exedens]SFD49788.1 hypothetical protein SAMN02745121_00260 [Nannocystis exedens]